VGVALWVRNHFAEQAFAITVNFNRVSRDIFGGRWNGGVEDRRQRSAVPLRRGNVGTQPALTFSEIDGEPSVVGASERGQGRGRWQRAKHGEVIGWGAAHQHIGGGGVDDAAWRRDHWIIDGRCAYFVQLHTSHLKGDCAVTLRVDRN